MDYAKALQVVAHELYIEKQRINLRNNCHNAAFMGQKRNREQFCNAQLDSMLDLTLWNNKMQVQVCTDSLAAIAGLNETSPDCVNDFNADVCDPCTKHYNSFFDKYDIYVLQTILGSLQKVAEKEQAALDKFYVLN